MHCLIRCRRRCLIRCLRRCLAVMRCLLCRLRGCLIRCLDVMNCLLVPRSQEVLSVPGIPRPSSRTIQATLLRCLFESEPLKLKKSTSTRSSRRCCECLSNVCDLCSNARVAWWLTCSWFGIVATGTPPPPPESSNDAIMAMPSEIWTRIFWLLLDPSDLWSSIRALIHVGSVCRYWCVSLSVFPLLVGFGASGT